MTRRPWYVRWLRAVERFAEWVQDDGWSGFDKSVPRTLDDFRRATPTRSE